MECNKTECLHHEVCREWVTLGNDNYINESNGYCDLYQPFHKSGKWIVDSSVDCYLDKVKCHCSECGKKKEFPADYDHIKQELSISYKYPEFIDNFCPNCGARMVEPQESDNCRDCKKWEDCPCGKDGHKSGTSQGYSIGECKDFEPQESEE